MPKENEKRGRCTHQVLMESHVRWRFSKLRYSDWMELLDQKRTSVFYDIAQ